MDTPVTVMVRCNIINDYCRNRIILEARAEAEAIQVSNLLFSSAIVNVVCMTSGPDSLFDCGIVITIG